MADERDNEGGNPPKEGSPGTPPAIGEHMIPKQRLDEVIAQRNKLQAEAEARAETDRKATEKKAIEDGEFQKVIDGQRAQIAELTAKAARFDALVAALEPQIDAESKDWPEEVKGMLALGETIEQKFAILPQARSLAAKLANGGQPPPPGTGERPKPKGGPDQKQQADAAVKAALRQGSYGF